MTAIYHNTDYKGNFIDNARVRQTPRVDQDIVNKGHLTDMFVSQGLDGFEEAQFSIKDCIIRNNIVNDKTIYQNLGWKVFVIVQVDINSRTSWRIDGYLRFDDKDIDFNLGPYDHSQSEAIYGITLQENQLLYVFDSLLYDGEKSELILPSLTAITFTCRFEEETITYEGHDVTHTAVTLSESCSSQEYRYVYDYVPILLDFPTYIASLDGQSIDTEYLPDTGIESCISDTFTELEISDPENIQVLTFIPQTVQRRYYVMVLDKYDNPITDRIYITQDNVNHDFTWLKTEYSQTIISLGYIPDATKLVISFDK